MKLNPTDHARWSSLLWAAGVLALVDPAFAHDGEGPHDHGVDKEAPTPAPYVVEAGGSVEDDGPRPPPKPAPVEGAVSADPSDEDLHERPSNLPREDWRRSQRRGGTEEEGDPWFDPSHFYFELRFGTYQPQVDDTPGLTSNVYERFFGTSPLFHFGLELDWLPLYIPWVGSLGPGLGWGFSEATAGAFTAAGTQSDTAETSLTIFPFHASAVFRIDGLLREASIPIVPYGKFGFGWALWEIDSPSGTAEVDGVMAKGTSYGLHYALGGALALNGFDRTAAIHMREETGIRYAYVFAEWYNQDLGLFGPEDQLYVGTSSAVFGLALEF